jgi:hypothetical protein
MELRKHLCFSGCRVSVFRGFARRESAGRKTSSRDCAAGAAWRRAEGGSRADGEGGVRGAVRGVRQYRRRKTAGRLIKNGAAKIFAFWRLPRFGFSRFCEARIRRVGKLLRGAAPQARRSGWRRQCRQGCRLGAIGAARGARQYRRRETAGRPVRARARDRSGIPRPRRGRGIGADSPVFCGAAAKNAPKRNAMASTYQAGLCGVEGGCRCVLAPPAARRA